MSHGQPCNHCGFEKSFPFLAYVCSTTFSSSLITQIASQESKKKKKNKTKRKTTKQKKTKNKNKEQKNKTEHETETHESKGTKPRN